MRQINTDKAPTPIGPYSQAIDAGGVVYASGQIAIDINNDNQIPESVEAQTHLVVRNLQSVLIEAGLDLKHIVKTTIYLVDMNDFAKVNKIYAEYFNVSKPARATVEVSRLPKDVRIEMDCIAVR